MWSGLRWFVVDALQPHVVTLTILVKCVEYTSSEDQTSDHTSCEENKMEQGRHKPSDWVVYIQFCHCQEASCTELVQHPEQKGR